jgi:hypothetical protein
MMWIYKKNGPTFSIENKNPVSKLGLEWIQHPKWYCEKPFSDVWLSLLTSDHGQHFRWPTVSCLRLRRGS